MDRRIDVHSKFTDALRRYVDSAVAFHISLDRYRDHFCGAAILDGDSMSKRVLDLWSNSIVDRLRRQSSEVLVSYGLFASEIERNLVSVDEDFVFFGTDQSIIDLCTRLLPVEELHLMFDMACVHHLAQSADAICDNVLTVSNASESELRRWIFNNSDSSRRLTFEKTVDVDPAICRRDHRIGHHTTGPLIQTFLDVRNNARMLSASFFTPCSPPLNWLTSMANAYPDFNFTLQYSCALGAVEGLTQRVGGKWTSWTSANESTLEEVARIEADIYLLASKIQCALSGPRDAGRNDNSMTS